MSSSLGLLGGYGSDSSADSDSYETNTPNKEQDLNYSSNSSSKTKGDDVDKNVGKLEFVSSSATTTCTSNEEEKSRSFFNVDCERDGEESLTTSSEEEEETNYPFNSASNSSTQKHHSTASTLPLPQLNKIHSGLVEALPGSVFSNPYKEAEDIQRSVLEHHVSLGPSEIEKKEEPRFRGRGGGRRRRRDDKSGDDLFDDRDSSIKAKKFNRRKIGVASGLVPSSKYMKLHEQQQAKERPWTLKR